MKVAGKSHTVSINGWVGGQKPVGFWDSPATIFVIQQTVWKDLSVVSALQILGTDYATFKKERDRLLKQRKIRRTRPQHQQETLREKLMRYELEGRAQVTSKMHLQTIEEAVREAERHGADSANAFLYPQCPRCGYRHA